MRLYLVRHGQVEAKGMFYGHMDVPLSENGRDQAFRAAGQLVACCLRPPQLLEQSPSAYSSLPFNNDPSL